ncbi:MAG: hypothetical protein AAGC55_11025 [Myxococcota bacterium]
MAIPAHADDDDDDDELIFGDDEEVVDATSDESGYDSEVVVTIDYPSAFLNRPRTLPGGVWEAALDLGANNDFSALVVGGADASNSVPGGIGFTIGVTDAFQAGVSYGFSLNDFEIKGVLAVQAAYLLRNEEDRQIVPLVSFGYSVVGESVGPIAVGSLVQYDLNERLSVLTRPALVILPGVEVDMDTVRPMSIELPVSLGYQLSDELYLDLATLAARAKVTDSVSGFVISDFLPLRLTALVTAMGSHFDVGLSVAVDARPGTDDMGMDLGIGDTLEFFLQVRYRGVL